MIHIYNISFTSLDSTLTTDNIVLATKDIPLWEKEDSYEYLDIPESQHEEIAAKYDGEQAKRELVSTWLASHPCPSWDHVVELVKKLEWEIGKEGLGDELEEKYLRSELQDFVSKIMHTRLIILVYKEVPKV